MTNLSLPDARSNYAHLSFNSMMNGSSVDVARASRQMLSVNTGNGEHADPINGRATNTTPKPLHEAARLKNSDLLYIQLPNASPNANNHDVSRKAEDTADSAMTQAKAEDQKNAPLSDEENWVPVPWQTITNQLVDNQSVVLGVLDQLKGDPAFRNSALRMLGASAGDALQSARTSGNLSDSALSYMGLGISSSNYPSTHSLGNFSDIRTPYSDFPNPRQAYAASVGLES